MGIGRRALAFRILFFLAVAAGGIYLTYLAVYQAVFYVAASRWKKIPATVKSLRLTLTRWQPRRGPKRYSCDVTYSYKVGGKLHIGKRATLYSTAGDKRLCCKTQCYPRSGQDILFLQPTITGTELFEHSVQPASNVPLHDFQFRAYCGCCFRTFAQTRSARHTTRYNTGIRLRRSLCCAVWNIGHLIICT